jgi:hypothetical protein
MLGGSVMNLSYEKLISEVTADFLIEKLSKRSDCKTAVREIHKHMNNFDMEFTNARKTLLQSGQRGTPETDSEHESETVTVSTGLAYQEIKFNQQRGVTAYALPLYACALILLGYAVYMGGALL